MQPNPTADDHHQYTQTSLVDHRKRIWINPAFIDPLIHPVSISSFQQKKKKKKSQKNRSHDDGGECVTSCFL